MKFNEFNSKYKQYRNKDLPDMKKEIFKEYENESLKKVKKIFVGFSKVACIAACAIVLITLVVINSSIPGVPVSTSSNTTSTVGSTVVSQSYSDIIDSDSINSDSNSSNSSSNSNDSSDSSSVISQPNTFKKVIPDDPTYSRFSDVIATDDGGFITTGVDFTSEGANSAKGTIEKYNANGDRLYKKTFDGQLFMSISKDNNQNMLITSLDNNSNYIIKFDEQCNQIWKKEIRIDNHITYCISKPTYLSNGNIAVISKLVNYVTYLQLLDTNGDELKRIAISYNDSDGYYSIKPLDDGGFLVCGNNNPKINVGDKDSPIYEKTNKGNSDGFVAKFSDQLKVEWATGFGGSSIELGIYVTSVANGNIYAVFTSLSKDKDLLDVLPNNQKIAQILVKFNKDGKIISKTPIAFQGAENTIISLIKEFDDENIIVCGWSLYADAALNKRVDDKNKEYAVDRLNFITTIYKNGVIKNNDILKDVDHTFVVGSAILKDGRIVLVGFYMGESNNIGNVIYFYKFQ